MKVSLFTLHISISMSGVTLAQGASSSSSHPFPADLASSLRGASLCLDSCISLFTCHVCSCFQFFGQMPTSGIAVSHGSSVISFLRSLYTVYHSGCTIFHSHQQCTRLPVSPHTHQARGFLSFLMVAIMGGVSCASVLSHPTYFLPMEVQDGASTDTGSRVAVPRAGGDARIGVKAEDLGYRKSSKTGCGEGMLYGM